MAAKSVYETYMVGDREEDVELSQQTRTRCATPTRPPWGWYSTDPSALAYICDLTTADSVLF
jgi:hypothetical protein